MKTKIPGRAAILALTLFVTVACSDRTVDPLVQIERAQGFVDARNYPAAVIELKNLLQQEPGHGLARLLLGETYLTAGDGSSAEKEFLWLLERGLVEERDLRISLARARILSQNFRALVEPSVDATIGNIDGLGLAPGPRATLMSLHGHGYFFEGQIAAARQLYQAALAIAPSEPEATLGEAMVAMRDGTPDVARGLLTSALEEHPGFAAAWSLLGDLERYSGNLDAANEAYSKAIENRSNQAHDLFGRGLTRVALGDIGGAESDVKRLQRVAGSGFELAHLRGMLEFRNKNYAEATARFQEALNLRPAYLPATYYAGVAAANQGSWNQAEAHLSRFLTGVPHSLQARKMLAVVRASVGSLDSAQELLRQVLEREPGDVEALDMLGSLAYLEGDFERGVEYFQRLVDASPESEQGLLKLGLGFLAKGEAKEAVSAFSQVTVGESTDLRVEMLLVKSEMESGDLARATLRAEDLRARHPDAVEPLYILGEIQARKGDAFAALASFEEALGVDPGYFPAVQGAVQLALEQSRPAQADAYLQGFLAQEPGHLRGLLALSDVKLLMDDQQAAVQLLERARELHPGAWRPRILLARHLRVNGKLEEALAVAAEAQAITPASPQVLGELGHAQLANGAVASAVDSYRAWVRLLPGSAEAHYYLARASAAAGSMGEAQAALEQSLQLAPQQDEARIALSRIYLTERQAAKAEPLVKALTERMSEHPDVLALQGDLALQQQRPADAAEFFGRALATVSSSKLVHSLGVAQISAGQASQAVGAWESWLKERPEDVRIRLNLANLYLLGQEWPLARQHYLSLVESGHANAAVFSNLAVVESRSGDAVAAVKYAERAVELQPDNAVALNSLGLFSMDAGQVEKALRAFDKALDREPAEPSYKFHKAAALVRLERRGDAFSVLEELLQDGGQRFEQRPQAEALYETLLGGAHQR